MTTKEQLAEILGLLDSESDKWNARNYHLNNLTGVLNPELFFIVAMKLDALITYLTEKGIIVDKDDFELHYRRMQFTKLREIRENLEKQEDEAKKQSDIVTPRPVLLGPDGNPVKM